MRKKTWLGQVIAFVAAIVRGIGKFFASQWEQFNPLGQAFFAVGVFLIGVDAWISFKYGWTQTEAHAFGFAGLAVLFFMLPDLGFSQIRKGNWGTGLGLLAACLPLGAACLWTHVGYSSGVRLGDLQQNGYSLAAYASADTTLKDKRNVLKLKEEALAATKKKAAEADERNKGWIVSVDPVAMQASLDAMTTKIENEAKRVRCGQKCEDLKVERGKLAARIALAKEENDLAGQIVALNDEIAILAAKVKDLAPPSSTIASQSQMAAKIVNVVQYVRGARGEEGVLKPSEFEQDVANTVASIVGSIALLICGAVAMVCAGLNRLPGVLDHAAGYHPTPVSDLGNRNTEASAYSPPAPEPKAQTFIRRPLGALRAENEANLRRLAAA